MMRTLGRPVAGLLLALLAAGPAFAHPGHGAATLTAGFAHPFGGWDHVLAMIAVGLLAARRGGPSLAAWPCAFVAAMLVGYGLGATYPGATLVEPAILASVIILGAWAAADVRTPFAAGLAVVAAFGLCHGYAHGAEAPAGSALAFPLGFALATAALHACGLAVGLAAMRMDRPMVLRLLGGGVVLGGAALALGG